MHAQLFLISQPHISKRRYNDLATRIKSATRGMTEVIRLENTGEGLLISLDRLCGQGASTITLRPVGIPFSQSLEVWLPKAVGEWLSYRDTPPVSIFMADDLSSCDPVIEALVTNPSNCKKLEPKPGGINSAGWDAPPPHRYHILVCAGPRCHLRDSLGLAQTLNVEINSAGIAKDCLITTADCLFPCNSGPVLVLYPQGDWFQLPDTDSVRQFVKTVLIEHNPLPKYQTFKTGEYHETI